jgi:hypothetical protein
MRTAVFAVLGAVVGYLIGSLGSMLLVLAMGLQETLPATGIVCLTTLAAAALFSLLAVRRGSGPDGRAQRTRSPQKWKGAMAALGAAVGPVIGFLATYGLILVSSQEDWRELIAIGAAALYGAPIGCILFCLLGFCLGSALDRRSPRNDSQQE